MSADTLFDPDDLGLFDDHQQRVLVMWYPDWPVIAAAQTCDITDELIAVFDKGAVLACSPAARRYGIKRGMRSRDAQSRCPTLQTTPYNPADDARAFEPILRAVEEISAGVEAIRPGMCATGSRGPSRYFGSEEAVIDATGDYLESLGYPDAHFGVADGPFAATQAAKVDVVVPPGESAVFLSDLPVDTLERPDLADVLRRMGLRTLGDFASLPSAQVSARFGADGATAHRLAAGRERRSLAIRTPPPELSLSLDLDPPHERVDTIAFAVRAEADGFITALARYDLVATSLRIVLRDEDGQTSERLWRHPRWFNSTDVVDRVRWQVQAATPADPGAGVGIRSGGALTSPITTIVITPQNVDRVGVYADGLWGDNNPDERIHRAFTRVQSMLDHTAVVTPVHSGGRAPAEHSTLIPWGEALIPRRDPAPPWPGRIPDPAPSQVLARPISVQVRGTHSPVVVSERGVLNEQPLYIAYRSGAVVAIDAWAGPWLSDERWWSTKEARQLARLQVTTDEHAYLLVFTKDHWWIEASYD